MWRAAEKHGDLPHPEEPAEGEGAAVLPQEDGVSADQGLGEGSTESYGGASAPGLIPSALAASRMVGGAPANDALDLPEGDGTYVNAEQWRFSAFFNRMHDAIRRQWRPDAVLRRKREDPSLKGTLKRHTVLELTLDQAGRLVSARVHSFSGSDFLDDEAVRAVRSAAPFPNPPLALFKGQPTFTFRFGFEVDFQHKPLLWFQGFKMAP
jgi:TonB family protein